MHAFRNIISIITTLLNDQEIDIQKTTMDFYVLEEKLKLELANSYIDKNIGIIYDQDEGLLLVNGKELKPSEILYRYDRVGYNNKISEFHEQLDKTNLITKIRNGDGLNQDLEAVILDYLPVEFEKINIVNAICDVAEVYIENIKTEKDYLTVNGKIYVAFNDLEHGSAIKECGGNFKANVTYQYNAYNDDFSFSLKNFSLDKGAFVI